MAAMFPVIALEGATPIPRCVVCEAQAHGVIEISFDILPVWSLADEDKHLSTEAIGLCRDCIVRLADGDTLRGDWNMEYVPLSVRGTGGLT